MKSGDHEVAEALRELYVGNGYVREGLPMVCASLHRLHNQL